MARIMKDVGQAGLDPDRNMQAKLHPNWAGSPILMLLWRESAATKKVLNPTHFICLPWLKLKNNTEE